MKLKNLFFFAFLFISIFLLQCSTDEQPNLYTYLASFADSNINIDGILDENAWENSKRVELKINETGEEVSDSTIMTWVRTCYDKQNIYIAFECNDSDIMSEFLNRDDHLWENDAVEIFIDTDGTLKSYYEIQVSPKNVLFDAHLEIPTKTDDDEIIDFDLAGIQTGVTVEGTLNMSDDIDRKWTVEIKIPIAGLNAEAASLDSGSWRINFFRMNFDSIGERPELGWSPTLGDFHIPSKFGVLKFKNYAK
ncbi:MAG: carbohydrate-binding family 9-like protein [Melioribacteraceae bacterium]